MKTLLSLIAFMLLVGSAAASAQDTSSLKAQMSPQAFKASGLDTLTPKQLATLDAWLRAHPQAMQSASHSSAHARSQPAAATMGAEDLPHNEQHKAKAPDRISSDIVGTFSGWHRGSIIPLANGQRWQVTGDSELYIPRTRHIKATIKRAFFGSYLLTVQGYNKSARVKRIQ